MTPFAPATADQLLAIRVNAGIEELARHERYAAAEPDLVEAIVAGVGEFAAGEFAPLNRVGDVEPARLENGRVILPVGYAEAYAAYVEQGWNAIAGPAAFGGQGLPFALACNVLENLGTANMAFTLLPILSVGAIEALAHHGSPAQKAMYLPKLVSGEWSGTMNLTEPQAGSDVGALRTTAQPIGADEFGGAHVGKYRIAGTKIFITWGDHELAGNIIHLVLARLPGAPDGSRGISLFAVPKYHVNADGSLGSRNDLRAMSLEHKLGINASPTCVMSFGEAGNCIGELVGAENRGLAAMFTMMNNARINVGNQGVQISERATQQAVAYAADRIQGMREGRPAAIVEHPDVRRMVVRMKALTQGARALLYYTAGQVDRGALGDERAGARAEVLVPLLKAWGTDIGVEVASLGVQVHGGMGFIEESGAAQHYRDARIAPIYEGTNGIQAADLVTRKLALQGGESIDCLIADIARDAAAEKSLHALARDCGKVAQWMRDAAGLDDRLAGSVPFCTMLAVAVAGWQLLRQLRSLGETPPPGKAASIRFFLDRIVPEASGQFAGATAGAAALYAVSAGELAD